MRKLKDSATPAPTADDAREGIPPFYVGELRKIAPDLVRPDPASARSTRERLAATIGRMKRGGVLHLWHRDRREPEPGCAKCQEDAERAERNPPSFSWDAVPGQRAAREHWQRVDEEGRRRRLGLDVVQGRP
jgi:hypothetical protein